MHRFILLATVLCLGSCTDLKHPDPPSVERHELTFVDETRGTPAVGKVEASDVRSLRVLTWIPKGGDIASPPPLLLMSHGWGGSIDLFETFAQFLASSGVAVAAVEYPCTNRHFEGGHESGLVDYPEQPSDYHFALNQLIAATGDPDHVLYRSFAPEKVVGLGHSLGGATLIRASRQACCADDRLIATIYLSPATFVNAVLLDEPEILPEGPPTFVAHGRDDPVITIEESEALIKAIDGPAKLVILEGANHESPLESEDGEVVPEQEAFQSLVLAFIEEHALGFDGEFARILELEEVQGRATPRAVE
jgi:alpha-beta hydrolase superfamily lysophospholipase